MVLKKERHSWRAVLDLKFPSLWVFDKKFRMESPPFVREVVHHNDFLTSVSLQDTTLHILTHCKYIRFEVGCHYFQYKALPFDLASPQLLTALEVHLSVPGIHI